MLIYTAYKAARQRGMALLAKSESCDQGAQAAVQHLATNRDMLENGALYQQRGFALTVQGANRIFIAKQLQG